MKFGKKLLGVLVIPSVIILSLIILLILLKKYTENFKDRKKYTIVCSRYNKNTDFLNKLSNNFDIKVIQKNGIKHDTKYVDHLAPNIANEATSYLSYIIKHYDDLPENMIFIHDENKSWHHDGLITDNINKWIEEYEKTNGYYEFNNSCTDKCGWCYKNKTFNQLWNQLFKNYKLENHIFDGTCCAQFIISKERIQKNSKEFYIKYYNWIVNNTTGEGNGDEKDPYSGFNTSRYAEWLWKAIFHKEELDKSV